MSKKRAQSKTKQQKAESKAKQEPKAKPNMKTEQPSEEKFSLYALLQLENGTKSTIDEIKKQYKKLVIIYHPDKNLGDDTAKQKFHKLKQAYDILSDPEQKKIYDQTGTLGNNFDQKSFQTAYQYFRGLYKKIEKQDIEAFEARYRNGEMEKEDLIQYYQNHQGDMTQLLECIPLSRNEDIPRFIQFFTQKISEKALKKYKCFDKTKDKVRELKDETEQFEAEEKKKQKSMNELIIAIKSKSNKSFLDSLQEKYVQPKKKLAEQKIETNKKKGRRQNKQ